MKQNSKAEKEFIPVRLEVISDAMQDVLCASGFDGEMDVWDSEIFDAQGYRKGENENG